uniref:One cut domain family member n=1 Tax=Caenorhabditis tropicalis TaxID=1561998 RepID=A0A1I7TXF5_9PELO
MDQDSDSSDYPPKTEFDEDSYIDTKDLCRRIAIELKDNSIPQSVFAEKILCRSQGTLSDLLSNPKPWDKLKSGRKTFLRMQNWLNQSLDKKMAILEMNTEAVNRALGMSPPVPAKHSPRNPKAVWAGSNKKRIVFTNIQKKTLEAIFKRTERLSREMQQTIASHLQLDLESVLNFFMNARRRNRNSENDKNILDSESL